jgi:hemoglobin/transferrin/lactoferrin receptor protein
VGSVGLVYAGIEGLSLRALYSQGFRAPTLSATMGKTQRNIPNPDLKPETSDNFEIGARYNSRGLTLDLALFYSILDNPFHYESTGLPHKYLQGQTSAWTVNALRAKSYGAELMLSYDIMDLGLTPYLSVTAMTYERETSPGKKTKDTGVPSSWGTGGLRFSRNLTDTVRFFSDASLTWSAGHKDEGDRNLAPAATADLEYASGWKADLTLGVEVGRESKTKATLSLKNMGDRYYEPRGYYQPGFHVVGSLSFDY